jgi:hypothetical protein
MDRDLPTARRWLPLLLAAMLFAQALGLVHRVLHAPAGGAALAQVQRERQGHDEAFGHDAGDVQCRLFDQLAQGDLAFGCSTTPAIQPAPLTLAGTPPAGRLAPQASGYLARGPPSLTA